MVRRAHGRAGGGARVRAEEPQGAPDPRAPCGAGRLRRRPPQVRKQPLAILDAMHSVLPRTLSCMHRCADDASNHVMKLLVPSSDAITSCPALRRLTLQLRVARRWQGAKARCAALAGAPLLWCSAASQVLIRPAAGGGGARREDSREGTLLLGGDSGASVMAQDGSGIVRASSNGSVVMSTAESSPVAAGGFAPLEEEGFCSSGAALCKKNH